MPDGLRGRIVTPQTAPAMAELRDKGVNFKNSHSLFPTFTMANGSAMASGHYLGDTGTFSNTIYTGRPVAHSNNTVTPFLEVNPVLLEVDEHFGGDYMNEETLLKMAREKGYSTAAIGKHGPTFIFDHTDKVGTAGLHSIIIDDATGGKNGVPLSDEMKEALTKANLPLATPPRGENSKAGDAKTPGTTSANVAQQAYMADVAAKVVLPMFKARNKPFVLVFWSRDPDGSQHNTGDSLNTITPGINGPTSMAGIKNADDNLAQLRKALDELGLAAIDQHHRLLRSRLLDDLEGEQDQPGGEDLLRRHAEGFSADGLPRHRSGEGAGPAAVRSQRQERARRRQCPSQGGNGLIGKDPAKPDVVVATNGGSDLIYIPAKERKLADRTIKALLEQDYVSGLFVDDELGNFPGTLPMSQLGLKGKAVVPHPSIVVNFRSWSSGCDEPTNCSVQIADTVLRQGQGMHGSFSRGDTLNFMAAIGPDFKSGYVDALPVSNADVGATAARLLGLTQKAKGKLIGRVMTEAMPNGATPKAYAGTVTSKPAANGLRTVLNFQRVGTQRYFDAAGFPGRTLGLEVNGGKQKTAGK